MCITCIIILLYLKNKLNVAATSTEFSCIVHFVVAKRSSLVYTKQISDEDSQNENQNS